MYKVLDRSLSVVAWFKVSGSRGQILDRSLRGIGWIEDDGEVLDRSSRGVGWAEVNEPWALMGAAAFMLLLR
jgi:hypothetical protein